MQGIWKPPATPSELLLAALPYFAVVYTGAAVVAQCMPLLLSYGTSLCPFCFWMIGLPSLTTLFSVVPGADPSLVTSLFVTVSLVAIFLQPLIGALSDRSRNALILTPILPLTLITQIYVGFDLPFWPVGIFPGGEGPLLRDSVSRWSPLKW